MIRHSPFDAIRTFSFSHMMIYKQKQHKKIKSGEKIKVNFIPKPKYSGLKRYAPASYAANPRNGTRNKQSETIILLIRSLLIQYNICFFHPHRDCAIHSFSFFMIPLVLYFKIIQDVLSCIQVYLHDVYDSREAVRRLRLNLHYILQAIL